MFDLEKILKDTLEAKRHKQTGAIAGRQLREILAGEFIDGEEKVFKAEYKYQLPYGHGNLWLTKFSIPEVIRNWAGIDKEIKVEDLLFYDTETTGLSGGVGTWVFLTGFGWFEGDEFVIRQYFMLDPGGEEAYLEALAAEFEQRDIPVSFNGRSYDANLINTRFIMNGKAAILTGRSDIDLLYLSRRLWRRELGKCNLSYLEEQLLGLTRNIEEDIPSEDIPGLYFDYLESGEAELLAKVFTHNRTDILSLPVLFALIAEILCAEKVTGVDESGLARLFRDHGFESEAEEYYKKGLAGNNASLCRCQLSFFYKRRGRIEEAKVLWLQDALTEIYALVELAKLAEHKEKDLSAAGKWTELALELVWKSEFINGKLVAELQKRLNRIEKKIEHSLGK